MTIVLDLSPWYNGSVEKTDQNQEVEYAGHSPKSPYTTGGPNMIARWTKCSKCDEWIPTEIEVVFPGQQLPPLCPACYIQSLLDTRKDIDKATLWNTCNCLVERIMSSMRQLPDNYETASRLMSMANAFYRLSNKMVPLKPVPELMHIQEVPDA